MSKWKYFAAAVLSAVAAGAAATVVSAETTVWQTANWNNANFNSWYDTPIYSSSSDVCVWVNGKDVKDNKKTPEDESELNKTGVIEHIAMSTGGKWNAVVTSPSVTTVGEFMNMLDSKGKFVDAKAADNKLIASVKIKDGDITVTAGKQTGRVNVWVYEVKKNQLVYLPQHNVQPTVYSVEVKMASGAPILAEPEDVSAGLLKDGAKAVSKLTLGYDSSRNAVQTTKKLAIADKKAAPDIESTFVPVYKNADKTEGATIARATVIDNNGTVIITPVGIGKTTISLTNQQSGKAAKLTVEVKGKHTVEFDSRLVSVDDMTNKKEPVPIHSGEAVIDGTTVRISAVQNAEVDQITAYGKSVKSGGTVKISGENLTILAGKTYPVTITGADKSNTVKNNGKTVKNGAAFLPGTELELVLQEGTSATVESGNSSNIYRRSQTLVISGDTKITIQKAQ